MSRDVCQHDPVLDGRPVEVVARRMAPLGEQGIVVTTAEHESARRDVPLRDPGPDLAHDVVDVPHVAHRRRVKRQRVESAAYRQEMAVRVDEAGQQRAVAELDDPRRLSTQGQHVLARPGRRYRLAADRHRLHGRSIPVHRDDMVAEKHDVRRRAGAGGTGAVPVAGDGAGGSREVKKLFNKVRSTRRAQRHPERVEAYVERCRTLGAPAAGGEAGASRAEIDNHDPLRRLHGVATLLPTGSYQLLALVFRLPILGWLLPLRTHATCRHSMPLETTSFQGERNERACRSPDVATPCARRPCRLQVLRTECGRRLGGADQKMVDGGQNIKETGAQQMDSNCKLHASNL